MALEFPPDYVHMPAHTVSDKRLNRSVAYTLAQIHALAWVYKGQQTPPTTTAELAQACRLSERQMRQHITILKKAGYIKKEDVDRNTYILHPLRLDTGAAITSDNTHGPTSSTIGGPPPQQTSKTEQTGLTSNPSGGPPPFNPQQAAVHRRSNVTSGGPSPPNSKQQAVDRRSTQKTGGGPPLNLKNRRWTAAQPKKQAVDRRSEHHGLKHVVVLNKKHGLKTKQQHEHDTPTHNQADNALVNAIANIYMQSGVQSDQAVLEAINLIAKHGIDKCQKQLEYYPNRVKHVQASDEGLKNAIGLYIKSLVRNWPDWGPPKVAKKQKTWYTPEEFDTLIQH